jgi:dTDP-4-amino-4,6-dideoxygalactose transaminase
VGTWGALAAFSFYPTKNLGGYGDGGAIATDDGEAAEKLRLLREYGWKERYISQLPGTNSRLDELQASVLRVKLRYLDGENRTRQELAGIYDHCLANSGLALPEVTDHAIHVYHQYVIRTRHRAEMRELLRNQHVHTLVHYPVPVHLQPAYRGRALTAEEGLPQTEWLCQEILSLPIHPHLTPVQAERVGQLVMEFCAAHRSEP